MTPPGDPRGTWYLRLHEGCERANHPWTQLRDHASLHARQLLESGVDGDLHPRDRELLETSDLDQCSVEELERRFLGLRAYRRRISVDQGTLLRVARRLRLHWQLGFASFGHYTRERLGLTRRTADHRADLDLLLCQEPVLRRAYARDQISDRVLPDLRRLIEMRIRGRDLRPWIRRAGIVPTLTFRDMVRWIEARREGWWANPGSGKDGETEIPPCPVLPPSYREWISVRRMLNKSPDALAGLSMGYTSGEPMSARGSGSDDVGAALPSGSADDPGSPANAVNSVDSVNPVDPVNSTNPVNPLIPSVDEPATHTDRIYVTRDVAASYLQAIDAVRVIFGDDKPAWWCEEVMMLHVRLDWARESRYCRANAENYDIFERDGFRCGTPGCGRRRKLHGHHLRFRSQGGSDDPSNIQTLCEACHEFGLHRSGIIRLRGKAPGRLIWELGWREDGSGRLVAKRRYLGEFRRFNRPSL